MNGRVIHFAGQYEGRHIDDIVELDPTFILWAFERVEGHGISLDQFHQARRNLDTQDEWYENDEPEFVDTEEKGWYNDYS